MRYLTRAAIEAAIPAATLALLTNDDPAADSPDEGVLSMAVTNVEELVDGYLRGRYGEGDKPMFTEVPSVLRGLAVNILRHELYIRRPEGDVPDPVKVAYANAVKVLEQIRDGRVTLGDAAGKPAPAPLEVMVRSRKPAFGGEQWERY